jgi:hypothetical protein
MSVSAPSAGEGSPDPGPPPPSAPVSAAGGAELHGRSPPSSSR